MRIRYPNSFLKLLLLGFAFATLPLMLAFMNSNIALNDLAKKSQTTINNAVKATRASLVLQQKLHLMERSAKQYFVLQDNDFFENYRSAKQSFNQAIGALKQVNSGNAVQGKLIQLEALSNKTHLSILNEKSKPSPQLDFLNDFNQMSAQVDTIINDNNRMIDATSTKLDRESRRAQSRFFLQSLILIPFSLLVTTIIAFLLGRPIRRMDSAIKDLGHGHYQQTISIDGPGDLRILGQRLDWLRQALLNLKEQKQQFLQHISHELKTPLTAIREAAELLTDEVGGKLTMQQQEIISIMRENSVRLQKMIEHLLHFTKMESEQHPLVIKEIDTAEFFNQAVASHALSIRNKRLHLVTDFASPTLIADESKLLIIIDNIISNAIKFSPSDSKISFLTKSDKHWQTIEIIDAGPGLSHEDKAQLFNPFYQGKTLHQGLVNSSGLGLTIAKNLIEEHHGAISLAENSTGAHFIVRLPILALTLKDDT